MRIFLDMDGVMFNFIGSLEKHLDVDLSNLNAWDIGKYLKRYDIDKVIDELDHDFWANIQPYDNIGEILGLCEYFSQNDVYICSSPANHPGSFSGKKESIIKHLPDKYSKKLILIKKKYLLANRYSILIDDSEYQINPFREHGGKAVVYPQSWNSMSLWKEDQTSFIDSQLTTITGR